MTAEAQRQESYGKIINQCENSGHERPVGYPCAPCIHAALVERDREIERLNKFVIDLVHPSVGELAILRAQRDALVKALKNIQAWSINGGCWCRDQYDGDLPMPAPGKHDGPCT